ncbi:MAG: ABC transporter ATP-binding protein [Anaerolineae bacterium]|nr:ABC transporter ATP-binding protein [Gemmatimonadaceae bacterium]
MKALRPLLPYFRPYGWSMALGLLSVIISSAFQAVVPWLLRSAIDGVTSGAPQSRIWMIAGAMVVVALASGVARYGMRQILNGLSRKVEYDLRNDLFTHLETLDQAYFAHMRTGDLMARMTNDLSAVRMAAGPAIMYFVNTIAGGIFALVFMLGISVRLTLLALVPLVLLPVIMVRLGKALHDRFEAVQEHFSTLTTRAQENIAGVRIVRAYRQEDPETARFAVLNDEYVRKNIQLVKLWGVMNPAFALLAGLAAAIVLGVGGALVVQGDMSIGSLVAFGLYLAMLTWPMIALGWVINLFQRAAASMARLNEIFQARSTLRAPVHPQTLPAGVSGRSIEFRDVGFHYPVAGVAQPRWVLRNVSFHLPAGATLGVAGATGSGKSALIDLIPRMYDPQEGTILIDGIPITEISLDSLRSEIGYVPQESFLFSDTVGENLAYGAQGDSTWAANVAQLEQTIAEFPGGYDTMLGERGINLSGGQKQRVALARALARRPFIVLLDDALSAVDSHTEAEIMRALDDVLGERSAVIASHRGSAIRNSDWIIVLEEGSVVEQGRHEELFAAGGRYWSLLSRQQLVDDIEDDDPLARNHVAARIST